MKDKNMKDKIHDNVETMKEKTAELKGEMKVKAQNAKKGIQKHTDSIKQKAAELKGEAKEHIKETAQKMHDTKEKLAKKENK